MCELSPELETVRAAAVNELPTNLRAPQPHDGHLRGRAKNRRQLSRARVEQRHQRAPHPVGGLVLVWSPGCRDVLESMATLGRLAAEVVSPRAARHLNARKAAAMVEAVRPTLAALLHFAGKFPDSRPPTRRGLPA
jgi:hypothetical protein